MSERIPIVDVTPVKVHKPDAKKHDDHYKPRSQIYVRSVKGPLENFRRYFGFFFMGLFALLPWITYNGHQAILLDLAEQRFTIFGLTLWPQDLTLLAWIFIIGAFALFFVTTFAGRVWCGFMCPQTTWTYIYMWIEKKCEGERNKRIKLDERSMDADKFLRKFSKHFLWVAVALLTSLTFVGYFTPIAPLFIDFFTFEVGFWSALWVWFFTFCTYGNAGWMREIMCLHICPYARFQSVMFDKDTLTVTYDNYRGEGRGPRPRKASREDNRDKGLGDCVDCNLCVQVCPTGIDIRNGLQYECINCGACVDACNDTMAKMNYPKGLIRYTSEHALKHDPAKVMRPKLVGYAFVLVVMMGLLGFELMTRIPLAVDIIRDRNQLYRETNDGLVENVYTLKIMNKSQQTKDFTIEVQGLTQANYIGDKQITVAGGELYTLPVSIAIDPYNLQGNVTDVHFKVQSSNEEEIMVLEPTKFLYR